MSGPKNRLVSKQVSPAQRKEKEKRPSIGEHESRGAAPGSFIDTHADAESARVGGQELPEVDADARAALATEHLVLLFRVELVPGHAGPRVAVPLDLVAQRVFVGWTRSALCRSDGFSFYARISEVHRRRRKTTVEGGRERGVAFQVPRLPFPSNRCASPSPPKKKRKFTSCPTVVRTHE